MMTERFSVQSLERHPTPKAPKRSVKQPAGAAALPLPKGRKGMLRQLGVRMLRPPNDLAAGTGQATCQSRAVYNS